MGHIKHLTGKYIGKVREWQGETAILQEHPRGVLAQFDNLKRSLVRFNQQYEYYEPLQFGWHLFQISEFEITEHEFKMDWSTAESDFNADDYLVKPVQAVNHALTPSQQFDASIKEWNKKSPPWLRDADLYDEVKKPQQVSSTPDEPRNDWDPGLRECRRYYENCAAAEKPVNLGRWEANAAPWRGFNT